MNAHLKRKLDVHCFLCTVHVNYCITWIHFNCVSHIHIDAMATAAAVTGAVGKATASVTKNKM